MLITPKVMAESFMALGYDVISGGTDNHCMLVDLRNKNITGKEAERVLGLVDITVNKNMVPFDTQSVHDKWNTDQLSAFTTHRDQSHRNAHGS